MTPEEWSEWLTGVSSFFKESMKPNSQRIGIHLLEIYMKERIFQKGKNTYGGKIGEYGAYYDEKLKGYWTDIREERGLQIGYVDLKFTGELENSIIAEDRKDSSVLKFANNRNLEKAQFQEELQAWKIGANEMDIFTISNEEIDKMVDYITNRLENAWEESLLEPSQRIFYKW